MPGNPERYEVNGRSIPSQIDPLNYNKVISAFVKESKEHMHLPIGPRDSNTSAPHGFTFDEASPHDDEALNVALKASYRQIFGNFQIMDSERCIDLERRLRNGDISIREFVRGLAKSSFYKAHYFEVVNQQRFIELSFKHILGRPPKNQSEIISHVEMLNSFGFETHIDNLIDSSEYQEVFGPDIVPYARAWDSQNDMRTSSFANMACLSRGFACSDNAIHGRTTLANSPAGASKLLRSLAKGEVPEVKSA